MWQKHSYQKSHYCIGYISLTGIYILCYSSVSMRQWSARFLFAPLSFSLSVSKYVFISFLSFTPSLGNRIVSTSLTDSYYWASNGALPSTGNARDETKRRSPKYKIKYKKRNSLSVSIFLSSLFSWGVCWPSSCFSFPKGGYIKDIKTYKPHIQLVRTSFLGGNHTVG